MEIGITENKFFFDKFFYISREITLIYDKIDIKYNDVKNSFYYKISVNIVSFLETAKLYKFFNCITKHNTNIEHNANCIYLYKCIL